MSYRFIFITFLSCLSLFCSCKGTKPVEDKDVLVRVKDRALSRSSVLSALPLGLSSADSLLYSENYVEKWIKEELTYNVAVDNLDKEEKQEINKLVDQYKKSLYRYRYQECLIKERISSELTETEKQEYYQQNQKKFELDHPIIKGLFLKIPVDAPGLDEIKKCYTSEKEDALQKIEKYSIQNASVYEYFYDHWVSFNEIIENVPIRVINANDFLKTHKFVEVSDSTFCYLLNIKEYLSYGSIAPYEYISPKVVEMIISQKKIDFLRKFEDGLLNDAVDNGDVQYAKEP